MSSTMTLFSGTTIDLKDIKAAHINIHDIAHALAYTCRFSGHTRVFYSVAEHSVHTAKYLEKRGQSLDVQRWGLLHDATEAYLGDVITPLKSLLPTYKYYEHEFMKAIAERFGLMLPIPEAVHEADKIMLQMEMRDLLHGGSNNSLQYAKIPKEKVKTHKSDVAEGSFLSLASTLGLS